MSCSSSSGESPPTTQPLFANSVVSTDFDFISVDDPSSYRNTLFIGRDRREMPDKRSDILFDESAFIFEAEFANRSIEISAHSSFEEPDLAESYVSLLANAMGKLPEFMLNDLSHVILHTGDETAFAEDLGNFFVLYSDNIDRRIGTHDLEETVFHESVHAVLDSEYSDSNDWLSSQQRDGNFITQYAADNPAREDLAETALFIYTMENYPERLPTSTVSWINTHIPNKASFIARIFN